MDAWSSVGVEEEFLLVDPGTGAPIAKNAEVARTAAGVGVDLQLELTRCQVETSTGVHTDRAELLRELQTLRRKVANCAAANGARLLATAIPPTVPVKFPVTDTPRFQRIADNFGMLAHEQGLSGCHVHVGIPDRETAVQVGNHLRPWLPVFLALSANSSIYRSAETGFASWRSILWRRWPSAGPPPYFESAAAYDTMVEMMLASGSILDTKMVYWDVRASESFPTVEIRVGDIPATAEESVLLATLIRATVLRARTLLEQGRTADPVPAEILRAAYWNAARSGLDGVGLDPVQGRVLPARARLAQLITYVEPALDELGDRTFVGETISKVLERGNGARRQLTAYRRGGITEVVRELASATMEGC